MESLAREKHLLFRQILNTIPGFPRMRADWQGGLWIITSNWQKLKLRGQNLCHVVSSKVVGCVHCCEAKLPNLKLKARPKQLLGSLPHTIRHVPKQITFGTAYCLIASKKKIENVVSFWECFGECKQLLDYQNNLSFRDIWCSRFYNIFKFCSCFQHQCNLCKLKTALFSA
jgi:hypothetical protein